MELLITVLVGVLGILVGIWGTRHFEDRRSDREKWRSLREALADRDLDGLEFCTYQARRIPCELLARIGSFVDDLVEDMEDVRFTPRAERRLIEPKKSFVKAYRAYREFVSVPFWDVQSDSWRLEKQYLIEQGADYGEHLRLACEQIDEMKLAYRTMYKLVHRW